MSQSPFLRLPRELRRQIYSHLLAPTGFVTFGTLKFQNSKSKKVHGWRLETPLCPAILRVSRQICDEAEDILYGANVLEICLPTYLFCYSPYVCEKPDASAFSRAKETWARSAYSTTSSSTGLHTIPPDLLSKFRKFSFRISWNIDEFVFYSYPHWVEYNPSCVDFQAGADGLTRCFERDQLPQIVSLISKRVPYMDFLEVRLDLDAHMRMPGGSDGYEAYKEPVALCTQKIRQLASDIDYFGSFKDMTNVAKASMTCGQETYDRDVERQIVSNFKHPDSRTEPVKRSWKERLQNVTASEKSSAVGVASPTPAVVLIKPNSEQCSSVPAQGWDVKDDPIALFLNMAIGN